MPYSHLKKRKARTAQSAATPTITKNGNRILPAPMPKKEFFIIVIPCVSGKKLTIRCIVCDMTSMGSVMTSSAAILTVSESRSR